MRPLRFPGSKSNDGLNEEFDHQLDDDYFFTGGLGYGDDRNGEPITLNFKGVG